MRERIQTNVQSDHKYARKHRPDYQIVLFMGLLMLLGLILIYAIGPQRSHLLNYASGSDNYSDSYFFVKQMIALGLALVAFGIMTKLPFSWFQKNARKLLLAGLGACLVLSVSALLHLPFAPTVLGAARWFDLGPLGSVQPSEFLKFAVVIFASGLLAARYKQGKINDVAMTLIPVGVLSALLTIFVVVLQKNLSTGIILVAIVMTMLYAAGLSKKIISIIFGVGVVLGLLLIVSAPHRISRVATFLQGDSVATSNSDENHQARQAHIAIGSGGIVGVGIGNSIQATGYLPESTNDSIFAIMGETFGFVGLVIILAVFTALLFRILTVADHLQSMPMKLAVYGNFCLARSAYCHKCSVDAWPNSANRCNVATCEFWRHKYGIYRGRTWSGISVVAVYIESNSFRRGAAL